MANQKGEIMATALKERSFPEISVMLGQGYLGNFLSKVLFENKIGYITPSPLKYALRNAMANFPNISNEQWIAEILNLLPELGDEDGIWEYFENEEYTYMGIFAPDGEYTLSEFDRILSERYAARHQ